MNIDLICLESEPAQDPDCDQDGTQLDQLHISFTRPYLDAYIIGVDSGGTIYNDSAYGFIRVTNPDRSQRRFITFWKTGQISVN